MSISATIAQRQLDVWLDANEKLAKGMTVTVEGVHLERENSRYVLDQITFWSKQLSLAQGKSGTGVRAVKVV